MSAFIVSDNSINRLATYIDDLGAVYFRCNVVVAAGLEKFVGDNELPWHLGKALLQLNCDSFNQRYSERETPEGYIYEPVELEGEIADASILLTLRCFTYQSCEGDCSERPLYKALIELRDWLTEAVAARYGLKKELRLGVMAYNFDSIPQYNETDWG